MSGFPPMFDTFTPPVRVVEIHVCDETTDHQEVTDYLIADAGVSAVDIMTGKGEVYCQVGNRSIADSFVTALNAHDDLVAALTVANELLGNIPAAKNNQRVADAIHANRAVLSKASPNTTKADE